MQRMMAYTNACDALQGTIELEGIGKTEAEKVLKWSDEQLEDTSKGITMLMLKKLMKQLLEKLWLLWE